MKKYFCFLVFCITSLLVCAESSSLPVTEISGRQYYVYQISKGESIYGIAKKNGWDLQELVKQNPEVANHPAKGELLYYPVEETLGDNEESNEQGFPSTVRHIVKRGENVYSISRLYDVPLEKIYQDNPQAKKGVSTGDELIIHGASQPTAMKSPTQKEKKKPVAEEITEETSGNLRNDDVISIGGLFNGEIIGEAEEVELDSISPEETIKRVRMALLLDDPTSKKDIDFTRGVLTALSLKNKTPYKIDLKVIDGRVSSNDIIEQLDNFEPSFIVSTADKAFPAFLADYGNTNEIKVINVFDLKNDLYQENASIIQILPPSFVFNEKIASQIYKDNQRRKFLAIGEKDENDGIGMVLLELFEENGNLISLEEFGSLEPDVMEPLLLYSFATRKEEVGDFLNNVENLNEVNPGLDTRIVGRLNWIAMHDDFGDKFEEFRVWIPSRVLFDENSEDGKKFINAFESLFGGYPVKSIPNFAASGYDIATYFIDLAGETDVTERDLKMRKGEGMIQNDIRLTKPEGAEGWINGVGYIIKYSSSNQEKMIVK